MLKQHFLVFVAAGAIAIAAPFAVAQDSPTNNQSSQPSQERAKGHHGHRDPAQRTQKLTKHLSLTSDQQTKVQEIFQSEQSQMQSLHQDSSLSQQDRRAKMMDIRKNADAQVRALLDSNQQKKWDEMQAKREQRMQKRHSEAGSDQPAPSPQQ
jgi:periplasmic protein CpxP/Spy